MKRNAAGFLRHAPRKPIPAMRKPNTHVRPVDVKTDTQRRKEQLFGNARKWEEVQKWLQEFRVKRVPLLLIGPCGVGKTFGSHTLAKRGGFDLYEINTADVPGSGSDSNGREQHAAFQRELYESCTRALSGKSAVLLDDIDTYPDYAIHAVADFCQSLPNPCAPIMCTCQSASMPAMKKLRDVCICVYLSELDEDTLLSFAHAHPEFPHRALAVTKKIARESRGDARQFGIRMQVLEGGELDERANIFEITHKLFSHDPAGSRLAYQEEPGRLHQMLFENYPRGAGGQTDAERVATLAESAELFSVCDVMRSGNTHQLTSYAAHLLTRPPRANIAQQNLQFPSLRRGRGPGGEPGSERGDSETELQYILRQRYW